MIVLAFIAVGVGCFFLGVVVTAIAALVAAIKP